MWPLARLDLMFGWRVDGNLDACCWLDVRMWNDDVMSSGELLYRNDDDDEILRCLAFGWRPGAYIEFQV